MIHEYYEELITTNTESSSYQGKSKRAKTSYDFEPRSSELAKHLEASLVHLEPKYQGPLVHQGAYNIRRSAGKIPFRMPVGGIGVQKNMREITWKSIIARVTGQMSYQGSTVVNGATIDALDATDPCWLVEKKNKGNTCTLTMKHKDDDAKSKKNSYEVQMLDVLGVLERRKWVYKRWEGKLERSHLCGRGFSKDAATNTHYCINPHHIRLESSPYNNSRKSCHAAWNRVSATFDWAAYRECTDESIIDGMEEELYNLAVEAGKCCWHAEGCKFTSPTGEVVYTCPGTGAKSGDSAREYAKFEEEAQFTDDDMNDTL